MAKSMAKKTSSRKASRKKPSARKATKRVVKKASGKKAARKPQKTRAVKKATKKTVKKAVTKKAVTSSAGKTSEKRSAAKTAKKQAGKSAGAPKSTLKARPEKKKKIKSPLSKKQLQEFRALLLEKRKSILGDMTGIQSGALGKNLQESAGDLSNMPTHPADIGSDNFEHEFTLGLLESERSLLREINEALERIDAGAYGVCLGTGEPIGIPRLKARPWCKYCIEYQKMVEKGLVRPGQQDAYASQENKEDEEEEENMEADAEEEMDSEAQESED